MGKQSKIIIKETIEELQILLKKEKNIRNVKRLNCLLFIKESKFLTRQELSDYLGHHLRTIERWLNRYQSGGIQGLFYPESRNSAPTAIPIEVQKGLAEQVADCDKGFASYVQAQQWISDTYSVDIEYNTVRQHLIKYHRTKIKSPRKSHIKKDEQAVEAFLKTT